MMKPYYEHAGITIYHGDARDVLPRLSGVDCVLTDPPYNVGFKYGKYDDRLEEDRYLFQLKHTFVLAASAGAHSIVWFWQGIRVANGEALKVLPITFDIHHLGAWYKKG